MVYENSGCTKNEIKTMHNLVAQVSRAFFDPHFVIILDRMMTSDMHLESGLGHQVGVNGGISASETNIGKLLKALEKQRLVKSFINYENSAGKGVDGLPVQKRMTMKRMYWYIDYHDFCLVIKYRLAVMRSQIEASMVKDDTAKSDYKCPQCGKEFDALQIPNLIQNLSMSMMDREGDFVIACDVCGAHLEPKMNEKEQSEADKKMEKFNNAMAPIRRTLQQVEKIEFERLDPITWLLQHVPETTIVERNAKGTRVYVAYENRKNDRELELTPEEKKARAEAAIARKLDMEKQRELLPTWAVQSTVTGQQTELGIKHDKLRQVIAERQARNSAGQEDTKTDTADADLDAHYAQLLAEEENATSVADPVIAKTESSPADSPGIGTGTMDDEDDEEMEAVDIKQDASGEIESLRNAIVKVGEQDMRYGDVTEEDQERMSSDEYMDYFRIAEQIAQLEDPAGNM